MSRTPDLETTREMYALYCEGVALQEVADRFGVSNQSVSKRFKRQGLATRPRSDTGAAERRFWAKVDKSAGPDGCWIWTAYRASNGYGWVGFGGRKQAAHRIAFQLATGDQLGDLYLDHKCFNPSCVNPKHLRPATNKQNMENRPGAQRNNKSTGVRGVYPSGRGFQPKVQHNGRVYCLGTYDTVEEAEAVARAKRLELFTHNDVDHATS